MFRSDEKEIILSLRERFDSLRSKESSVQSVEDKAKRASMRKSEPLRKYSADDMKNLLSGYKFMGSGVYTVALYHPNSDQILLLSQDRVKKVMAALHAEHPDNPNLPKIKLIAQTLHPHIPESERPAGWSKRKGKLVSPIFIYTVPEYQPILYDVKKQKWFVVRGESTIGSEKDFWKNLKKSDVRELSEEMMYINLPTQINYLLAFLKLKMSEVEKTKGKHASAKVLLTDIALLDQLPVNRKTKNVKAALEALIQKLVSIDESERFTWFGWDFRLEDQSKPKDKKWTKNLYLFTNVFANRREDEIVLLDLVQRNAGMIPFQSGIK